MGHKHTHQIIYTYLDIVIVICHGISMDYKFDLKEYEYSTKSVLLGYAWV